MQKPEGKQRQILDALLEAPHGLTLAELAEHLEVTKTAAKEHVVRLLDLGHLRFTDSKGQVGRPKRRYFLTETGDEVFPRQYAWLSNTLLAVLAKTVGAVEIAKILRKMAQDVAATMEERLARSPTTAKRVAAIVDIMTELGYRARARQKDARKDLVIEASNCVYHSVAKEHPELCQFDIYLLESMSGARVRLDSCIARGGDVCRFCFRADAAKAPR
jgi:predicted ArsR family transcriptional regulator